MAAEEKPEPRRTGVHVRAIKKRLEKLERAKGGLGLCYLNSVILFPGPRIGL